MPAARSGPDSTTAARDARRLSTLLEVSQALSGTLNLKAAMQRVLQTLIRHHSVVRGMVTLLREGELHVEAVEGFEDRARSIRIKVGEGITGKVAEAALGHAGITVNKNAIPFDPEKPFVTSGIRIGTPAVTTRGMREGDMKTIAGFIARERDAGSFEA